MAAAFDTRIKAPTLFTGSTAKGIAHRLDWHGYAVLTGAESFLVSRESELIDGEVDHATAWGARMAQRAATGTTPAR